VAILAFAARDLLVVALLDLVLAATLVLLARPLLRRFGSAERDW
jgi:hypothetical protein